MADLPDSTTSQPRKCSKEIVLAFDKKLQADALKIITEDEKLQADWTILANALGTPIYDQTRLKHQKNMDIMPYKEVIREIFVTWISSKGKQTTIANLCGLLRTAKLTTTSERLENEIKEPSKKHSS